MQAARLATRLQREIRMLESDPPPGVCAWPCEDSLSHLQAQVQGPDGTVYAKGLFKLEVRVPERYPFEPPNVKFQTPIYHPNIDSGGRICLDILNMPPKGSWKPSMNIPTVLASIGLLLADPNPDDGLMGDITAEYKHNRLAFDITARNWTLKYARQEESATGDNCARNPVAPDNVQQNPSTSVVQSSTEDRTTVTNQFGKCSVVSNSTKSSVVGTSKLNLGAKLSLEKGSKEVGKQSTDSGGVFAVTSKRAFASIENTVGTRQIAVQESPPLKKTLAESDVVGKRGNGTDMRPEHNENSPVVEGSDTLASSAVYSHKVKSSGPSIEFGKFKRPREGRASPTTQTHRACCSDKDELSLSATTSSLVAAVESECLEKSKPERREKEIKCVGSSFRPLRNSNTQRDELPETGNNLGQDGPKSGRVESGTGPVRIPMICKPVDRVHVLDKNHVRSSTASTAQKRSVVTPEGRSRSCFPKSFSKVAPAPTQEGTAAQPRDEADQASASAAPKRSVETPEGRPRPVFPKSFTKVAPAPTQEGTAAQTRNEADQASASTAHKRVVETPEGRSSSCFPKSSTKVAPAPTQECTSAQPRDEAETFMHGRAPNVGSSYKSIDQYLIRTSVARCPSVQGQEKLVAKSLTERSGDPNTIDVSGNVQRRVEPESKGCQSANVDMVIIPDEIESELKKASESVKQKLVKKPPHPAKPITDIIVLDSESDDEPPKGRSRLSLSRRKVVRSKTKG